jgi:hypothetical protein
MPIFNKEELKIVIKAFAVNVKKAKSNRDKAKKDPTNRKKKKKEDGDNERFIFHWNSSLSMGDKCAVAPFSVNTLVRDDLFQ